MFARVYEVGDTDNGDNVNFFTSAHKADVAYRSMYINGIDPYYRVHGDALSLLKSQAITIHQQKDTIRILVKKLMETGGGVDAIPLVLLSDPFVAEVIQDWL